MRIDLHNHTNYSDGIYTPEELFNKAYESNLDVFALTDHDSVFGCEEILKLDGKNNVRVILGMELSTEYKGHSVHIVCLFKNNIVPKELIDFSNDMVRKRHTRAVQMMNNIKNIYNLKIDLDLLFKEADIITRGNMVRNICICNNMSLKESGFYVSSKSLAYIPSTKLDTKAGIEFAKSCGCITILAHPCLLPREIVQEIIGFGFDGLEVYYPDNKNDDEFYFKQLASKYNLLISAGSDCHGDASHAPIGTSVLNEEEFKPMAERLGFSWK